MRLLIVVIAAMLLGSLASKRASVSREGISVSEGLIRDCPEHWYVNRMPQMGMPDSSRSMPDEYFVYKGMRHELMEFDMPWMQRYCSQAPEYLY